MVVVPGAAIAAFLQTRRLNQETRELREEIRWLRARITGATPADIAEPTPTEEPDLLVHRVGEALGEAIWATSYDQLTPAQKEWVKRATEEISPVADPMANTVAITVDAVVRTIEPNLPRP